MKIEILVVLFAVLGLHLLYLGYKMISEIGETLNAKRLYRDYVSAGRGHECTLAQKNLENARSDLMIAVTKVIGVIIMIIVVFVFR